MVCEQSLDKPGYLIIGNNSSTLTPQSLSAAVPSPPGAPEIVASGKDFATVQWLKPESDGGSPLIHYLVERREKKSARWVKINRDGAHLDTTLKVSGLTEGNIYQFRVTAINKAGESEASEVSLYVVCRVPTCKCKYQYQYSVSSEFLIFSTFI